jgi:hypothetical protein
MYVGHVVHLLGEIKEIVDLLRKLHGILIKKNKIKIKNENETLAWLLGDQWTFNYVAGYHF